MCHLHHYIRGVDSQHAGAVNAPGAALCSGGDDVSLQML